MGRARSAVAARVSVEAMRKAVEEAFGVQTVEQTSCDDFYDAMDFCRPHSEMLGGKQGQEAWYVWRVGEWAVLGDLSVELPRKIEALERLSGAVGELILGAMDSGFEYACFGTFEQGKTRRLLVLEDEEIVEQGLPIKAERGHFLDDFDEEVVERLWTGFGLPTFEHDPLDGPFTCFAVQL